MNQSPPTSSTPSVSLLPREHGAYAEMAFPQVTALALGGIHWGAVLFVVAVVCGFLLHEPILVWTGRRGKRIQKAAGDRGRSRVLLLGTLGLIAGLGGLLLSSTPARIGALGALLPAFGVVALVAKRAEKTTLGELAVAVAFAAASIPTALASGVVLGDALISALVWALVFGLGTISVKGTIERFKTGRRTSSVLVSILALAAILGALILAVGVGGNAVAGLGLVPTALLVLLVTGLGVKPRKLRWIGWSMVVTNLVTLAILLLVLR